jgi:hypothetical protein
VIGEDAHEPLDRLGQGATALVVARLTGPRREQVTELALGHREKATIRGNPHDRLGDAEGDQLGVRDQPPGIGRPLGQEIISRAINGDAESVEVGVHRGLRVDGALLSTADFDLSAQNPVSTAMSVESLI